MAAKGLDLHHTMGVWNEFRAPGFSLAQLCCQHLGINQQMEKSLSTFLIRKGFLVVVLFLKILHHKRMFHINNSVVINFKESP